MPSAPSTAGPHRWVGVPADERRAERRRLNTLNYGDLLNLSAGVLRSNPQVRRALQAQYRHLFVDEFQDTAPSQYRIFDLLYRVADNDPNLGLFLIGIRSSRSTASAAPTSPTSSTSRTTTSTPRSSSSSRTTARRR